MRPLTTLQIQQQNVGSEDDELLGSRRHSKNAQLSPAVPLGIPLPGRRLWISDYVLIFFSLLFLALALLTVFDARIAAALGQVNQLIVLGVLLQLMALCTQSQARYFLLIWECLRNKSSLQNYESIIQASFTIPNSSIVLRVAIFLFIGLPVALGIAYKQFTGGLTESAGIDLKGVSAISYGMTGPPTAAGLGTQGMALFLNATSPWWLQSALTNAVGVFGFNLDVEGPDRTAMLDGPTPESVSLLQGLIKQDDTLILSTTVNATVTEMVIDLTDKNRKNDLAFWYGDESFGLINPAKATNDYWAMYERTQATASATSDPTWKTAFSMFVQGNDFMWPYNNSFIMTSRFAGAKNETAGTAAQGFKSYRQQYNASWTIKKSSIALRSATPIPNGVLKDYYSIKIIQNNWLQQQIMYPQLFLEYDWKYMSYSVNSSKAPQHQHVKTDTTLVAAMLWSRLTAYQGLASNTFNGSEYRDTVLKYPSNSTYRIRVQTLKQSHTLGIVLAVNPFILFVLLSTRLIFLRNAPISKEFGMVSLLAGIEPASLPLLKGAAYSGRLKEDVYVRFTASRDTDLQDLSGREESVPVHHEHRITTSLEARHGVHRGRMGGLGNDRIKAGVVYH